MPIDVKTEKLIRLSRVPSLAWLPTGIEGEPVHYTTVYNWARAGLKGGIRLETVRVGGSLATSEAALMRFFERLEMPHAKQSTITPSQAARAHAIADAALAAVGI